VVHIVTRVKVFRKLLLNALCPRVRHLRTWLRGGSTQLAQLLQRRKSTNRGNLGYIATNTVLRFTNPVAMAASLKLQSSGYQPEVRDPKVGRGKHSDGSHVLLKSPFFVLKERNGVSTSAQLYCVKPRLRLKNKENCYQWEGSQGLCFCLPVENINNRINSCREPGNSV
jgi:hypothetical protein